MNKEWHVKSVDKTEYSNATPRLINSFNSMMFSELNQSKVDMIDYILIQKGDSSRFAMTIGYRGQEAFCPFSAPFSYPEKCKDGLGIDNYVDAANVLNKYFKMKNVKSASITFPPYIYDKGTICAWQNALFYAGWGIDTIDINFALDLKRMSSDYESGLARNAKKNYHIAMKSELQLRHCDTEEDKRLAYEIIKKNRESKGFPLRMTLEQVLDTMKIIPSNMFIISHKGEDIASALIYDVTSRIAQVVYWGDILGYSELKAMNYLAYKMTMLYSMREYDYLDIGPSTENGIPNFGLCDFKDSIGCDRMTKIKMTRRF